MSQSTHQTDNALATTRHPGNPVARLCTAKRADGGVCSARPVTGGTTCIAHSNDPAMIELREASRRLGGYHATAASRPALPADTTRPSLRDADSVRALLEDTIHNVNVGALSPAQGHLTVAAVNANLKLIELSYGAQLAELEAEVARRKLSR